jgi:chromosome segregation ATPase
MKRHELQKPLIQSALILLAILLLIGFVAGSNAESFLGGLTSIFKGAFFTVLFIVALAVALLFSIVVLIGVYLGALAMYNPQSAKQTFSKLQQRIADQIDDWKSCRSQISAVRPDDSGASQSSENLVPSGQQQAPEPPVQRHPQQQPSLAVEEITELRKSVAQLSKENQAFSEALAGMAAKFDAIEAEEAKAAAATQQFEEQRQELAAGVTEFSAKLEEVRGLITSSDQQTQQQNTKLEETRKELASLTKELEKIKKTVITLQEEADTASSAYETGDYRIFSYFDEDNDKQKFIELIKEAVTKEMTYADIDAFLSKSLPEKVDAMVKDHPSLTREYIRDQRKKNS